MVKTLPTSANFVLKDNIIGSITFNDAFISLAQKSEISPKPIGQDLLISGKISIQMAIEMLANRRVPFLLVTSSNDGTALVGIITQRALMKSYLNLQP